MRIGEDASKVSMLHPYSFAVGADCMNAGFALSVAAQTLLAGLKKGGPRKHLLDDEQAAADELEDLNFATWTKHGFSITPCGEGAPRMLRPDKKPR